MPLTDSWLSWLGLMFEVLGKVDWLNALLIIGGFSALILLMVWQLTPGDGFDLRSLVAEKVADVWVVSPGKFFQTGAFAFTSWAFVTLVVRDKLSELFLLVYVVCWAGSRAVNMWAQSKFQAPAPTETTTEVKP